MRPNGIERWSIGGAAARGCYLGLLTGPGQSLEAAQSKPRRCGFWNFPTSGRQPPMAPSLWGATPQLHRPPGPRMSPQSGRGTEENESSLGRALAEPASYQDRPRTSNLEPQTRNPLLSSTYCALLCPYFSPSFFCFIRCYSHLHALSW